MLTLHAAHGEGQSREGARATGCTRVQRRGCLPPVLKHFNILTLVHANWTSFPSPAFSHCFSYAQMTPLSPCISAQLHYFPPSQLTCRFLRRASHCLLHCQCKVSIRRVRRGRGRRRKREVQEEAMQHGGEPCSDLLGEEEGEEKPSSIWWSRDASAALIGVEWEVKLIDLNKISIFLDRTKILKLGLTYQQPQLSTYMYIRTHSSSEKEAGTRCYVLGLTQSLTSSVKSL